MTITRLILPALAVALLLAPELSIAGRAGAAGLSCLPNSRMAGCDHDRPAGPLAGSAPRGPLDRVPGGPLGGAMAGPFGEGADSGEIVLPGSRAVVTGGSGAPAGAQVPLPPPRPERAPDPDPAPGE